MSQCLNISISVEFDICRVQYPQISIFAEIYICRYYIICGVLIPAELNTCKVQ